MTVPKGVKLRERIDNLEALAASATHGSPVEKRPVVMKARPIQPKVVVHQIAESIADWKDTDQLFSEPLLVAPSGPWHLHSGMGDDPPAPSISGPESHVDSFVLLCDNYDLNLNGKSTSYAEYDLSSEDIHTPSQSSDSVGHDKLDLVLRMRNAATLDPQANSLCVDTLCITTALYTLSIYVGITEDILCDNASLAPFCISAESSDDIYQANSICATQEIFKTMKPDLRPSGEQITIRHHPYIDLFPFPTLRRNLIIHQAEIDEDEFFPRRTYRLGRLGRRGYWAEGSSRINRIYGNRNAMGLEELGSKDVVLEEILGLAWW
ncbi:MAG: hypothetical protein Q9220_006720 [cf. Caloplaca sp. 1 TL-2023]